MEHRPETLPHMRQDLLVRLHAQPRPREVLRANQHRLQRIRLENRSGALEPRDRDGLVRRVREPARVDDGRVGHVGGRDADGATGERGGEADGDGGVVVAVNGPVELEVLLVAVVGGGGEVFDLGPVGGEGGEVGERPVGEAGFRGWGEFFECCWRDMCKLGSERAEGGDLQSRSAPVSVRMPVAWLSNCAAAAAANCALASDEVVITFTR